MRSTTLLAHLWRVSILAVALLALPQLASAQLPLETKSLKIQAQTGTDAVTLTTPATVTPYSITLPGALAPGNGAGAFMYTNNTTGGLSWTNFPTAAGWSVRWDGTNVVWFDPAGADNPNWSLTGNAITTAGRLGTTTAGGSINIITGDGGLTRMTVEANGNINIATDATNGGDVTIGNDNAVAVNGTTIALAGATSTTINAAAGVTNINTGANASAVNIGNATTATLDLEAVATTIAGTSVGITAATTQTGALALAGASSPFVMGTDGGADGEVLVSKGPTVTPEWQNLNEAIGIRAAGNVEVAGTETAAITIPNLTATDAILITLQGGGSTVVPTVTSRTNAPALPGNGTFVVTLSGSYTGRINYMVIKQL